MTRALFITRDNLDWNYIDTEVRIIEQYAENLFGKIPDDFQPVLSFVTEERGKEVLKIGFMEDSGFPDTIGVTWETIPTEGLRRVTLHDVDITFDPGHDIFFPECIGEPVMTLYDAISPERFDELRKAELLSEEADLVAKAKSEAEENSPRTEDSEESKEYAEVTDEPEEVRAVTE